VDAKHIVIVKMFEKEVSFILKGKENKKDN
jgi:hypothetical protein